MVTNPFEGLINGVLAGHAIAHQLRQQAMQEEAFQRQKVRDDQEGQLRDMEVSQMMSQTGRPVTGNMVQEQFNSMIPSDVPGVPGSPLQVSFSRPVDKSRLRTYKKSSGETIQNEMYSEPEQVARHYDALAQQGLITARNAGQMKVTEKDMMDQAHDAQVAREGRVAPQLVYDAGLLPPGKKALDSEIPGLIQEAQKLTNPEYKEVPQGGSLYQVPKPSAFGSGAPMTGTPEADGQAPTQSGPVTVGLDGSTNPLMAAAAPGQQARANFVTNAQAARNGGGPQIVASSPEKKTGDFERIFLPAYAAKFGTTVEGLTPDQTMAATTEYSRRSKNPTELALEQARLNLDRQRLTVERHNAGLDENGQPIEYFDANGQPKNISLLARQIAAYKMPPSAARSYAKNQPLMNEVLAVNPTFDIGQYEQRQTTFKDLAPGGKLGQQSLALNTLIRHTHDLLDAIPALGNGNFTPANAGYQKLVQLFGGSAPTNFDQLKTYVAGETVKLVRSGGGTAEDEKNASANILRSNSPEQLVGALKTNFTVAGGKLQSLNEAVRKATNDPKYTALDPGAAQILTKRGYDTETMKPQTGGGTGAATHRFNPATGQIEAVK